METKIEKILEKKEEKEDSLISVNNIVYHYKGYTLLQSVDNWRYVVQDPQNETICKSASSMPLTREQAERAIEYAIISEGRKHED